MVGSAILDALRRRGNDEIVTRSRAELNLGEQEEVREFFSTEQIDCVYLAAAKVGGIRANNELPADFIYENLLIQCNVIRAAFDAGVKHLLFLGSSCIYPKDAPQPMPEEALLKGPLEPTNEPYAIAKLAGIKLCESLNRQFGCDYRSVMPTNLYGPNDNYHPTESHVVPALIRRFHEAQQSAAPQVSVWGSGKPQREFLHVDDMARACLHIMDLSKEEYQTETQPMRSHINVGYGSDLTIRELAKTIARVVGYEGDITFDTSKPDGMTRKLLDSTRINRLGWRPQIDLEEGLRQTYEWFVKNHLYARGT